jgi:hypothetical protein
MSKGKRVIAAAVATGALLAAGVGVASAASASDATADWQPSCVATTITGAAADPAGTVTGALKDPGAAVSGVVTCATSLTAPAAP